MVLSCPRPGQLTFHEVSSQQSLGNSEQLGICVEVSWYPGSSWKKANCEILLLKIWGLAAVLESKACALRCHRGICSLLIRAIIIKVTPTWICVACSLLPECFICIISFCPPQTTWDVPCPVCWIIRTVCRGN